MSGRTLSVIGSMREAARRSSSPSYHSFKPRAVSSLFGFSPTQNPMLAMSVKLSPRAEIRDDIERSRTGGHNRCGRRSALLNCFRMVTGRYAVQNLLEGSDEIADII